MFKDMAKWFDLKTQDCSRIYAEKAIDTRLQHLSIPIDLSRINES